MPQITYSCPDCSGLLQASFEDQTVAAPCPACNSTRKLQDPELANGYLKRCIACPSTELFVRKDFPQRLGVAIVVTGFVISSVFWYYHNPFATFAVLLLTALIDVVLFMDDGKRAGVLSLSCAISRSARVSTTTTSLIWKRTRKHRQQAIRLKEAKEEKAYREATDAFEEAAQAASSSAD